MSPTMRFLPVLRLLLDVYGAAFLGYLVISAAVYGLFPYEALLRLGSLMFYALLGGAFVVWLWLAGRRLARRDDTDNSNLEEN